jgi:hypothetical protein
MRYTFCNEPEDCQWLRDTQPKVRQYEFQSFIIYGNEDAPEKVELFASRDALITDVPILVTFGE